MLMVISIKQKTKAGMWIQSVWEGVAILERWPVKASGEDDI